MSNGNVNWLEALWTVMGSLGLCVSCWGILDSYVDWQLARLLGKPKPTRLIALANIRKSIVRTVSNMIVVSIGILAMTLAPSPLPRSPLGWLITIGLFVIPACTIFNCIEDRRLRHNYLRRSIDNIE